MNITGTGVDLLGTVLVIMLGLFAIGLVVTILLVGLGFITRLIARVIVCVFGIVGDAVAAAANLLVAPFTLARALVMLVVGRFREADASAARFQARVVEVGRRAWSAVVQRPLRIVGVRIPPHARRHAPALAAAGSAAVRDAGAAVVHSIRTASPARHGASPPPPGGQPPPPWPDPSAIAAGFPGYVIETRMPSGGSGARLYAAMPEPSKRASLQGAPARVVIKSFAIGEGSTLPQIIRESRSLEAARSLGLVLDHALEPHRFWYAMPHYDGPTLTALANERHRSGASRGGLAGASQRELVALLADVVDSLTRFHRAGLWHKDVKPDNIIVSGGRAHLIDVGLVTPLASTFTLTTHGTEYFRDPEMVRQALRGAKVHQVDGAKFDVYSAGAVLYAILENTFPAHGPLSRFEKPSPESLRWIVRRAMADYQQRYATADEMLADLRFVLMASDAHAVRPMDLPSMREGAARADLVDAGSGRTAAGANGLGAAAPFSVAASAAAAAASAAAAAAASAAAASAKRWGTNGPWSGFVKWRAGRGEGRTGAVSWSPWMTAAVAVAAIVVAVVKSEKSVRITDRSRSTKTVSAPVAVKPQKSGRAQSPEGAELPEGDGLVLVERRLMLASPLPETAEGAAIAAIGSKGWTPIVNDPEAFAALASLEGREPAAIQAELARRGYRGLVRLEPRGQRVHVSPVAFTER